MEPVSPLVERARLIGVLRAAPVALVEAGSGYGKSVFASQYRQVLRAGTAYVTAGPADRDAAVFASSIRRALRESRLSDLAAALEGVEPGVWMDRLLDGLEAAEDGVLVIVDDAHNLRDAEAAQSLIRLAQRLPAQHRLLVAARSFRAGLEELWGLVSASRVTASELEFTLAQAAELVQLLSGRGAREHDVRMLVEATNGWATALNLTTRAWVREERSLAWLGRNPVAGSMRTLLQRLSSADQRTVIGLAHLPFLSPEIADAIAGEGTFERVVSAGLPVLRTDSGWWEFPGLVSDYLAGQGGLDPAVARIAAGAYARHGDELAAIRALLSAGCSGDAAAALGVGATSN